MPVTTILQHAIERDIPATAGADPDTRMSNTEGNVVPDHIPIESNLDSAESRSPKTPRAPKGKRTATAISSNSSPPPKQPRKASASTCKRQRNSSSSSTQIASETNYCTLATEEPLSSETLSLGASFFAPLGMSNSMFNGTFNSMEGAWEPQLTYWHTTPAPLTNWASENPFPNAYVAAEEAFNLYDNHSTTASPFTSQSNSEQRSSFASSAGHISPASYFTAHSSPMGYKPSQTAPEGSATTTARNEQVPDQYPQATYSLQHMNQQAVTSSQEEEGALHQVAAARLAEIPQPAIVRQPVPTIGQVPPAEEKVNSNPPTSSSSRPTLRSSSSTHPAPEMNPSSESPNPVPDMITRSQSRSAAARQRAISERRRRAASQSAASQNADDSSVAASVPVAASSQVAVLSEPVTPSQVVAPSQTAVSSQGAPFSQASSSSSQAASSYQASSSSQAASSYRTASSSQAASSSQTASSSSQAAASSQNVPPQENSSHAAEALQRAHQRRLAAEATRQLYASQSTISPYFTNIAQHIPSHSANSSTFSTPFSSNYDGPSPALSNTQLTHPQFPDFGRFPYTQEGAHLCGQEYAHSEALGSDYGGPRSAAIPMKVDPAFQQPPGMSTHQSQPYPIVHSQEIKNEPWTSYAAPGSSYGPQGVHDPSWHNGQAIRRGNPTDDVQEGSREAWQAAKNVIPERRALSRATSMAPSSQQNAARRLASFTPSIQRQTPQQAHSYEGSYDYLRPNAGQRLQSFTPSIQGQTPSPAQAYEGPRETRRPSAAQRLQSYTPSVQGQTPSQQTHPDERSRESLRANAAQRHQSYTPSIQEQTPSAQRLESSTPGNRRHRLSSADSDEISRNKRRRESILRKKVQNTFLNLYHQVDEAESRAEKAEARISRAQSLALDAEARAQEAQVQALDAEARAREAQAQIHAQATQPPTLPVLEPRIRILVPVCVSGASLVPPPTQAFEIAFQVQEPALVEGREARQ